MSRLIKYLLYTGALSIVPWAALAQQDQGPGYGPYMWHGGWFGWIVGPFMMILFVAVAAIVVVLVIRWLGGSRHELPPQHSVPRDKTPLDILKERFAKGEIDIEEFEERRRVLSE